MAANGINHEVLLKHLFDRIHQTGERVKNDFPNALRTAIEYESWKHFRTAEGKPFAGLADWLHYAYPRGADLARTRFALTYGDAMKLCEGEDHKDVYEVLARHAPNRGRGRPKKETEEEKLPRGSFDRSSGHRKPVLAARLAQEKPDFYEAYLRGQYRSVRAAAEAAGLVPPGHDPLARLKSYWRKATAQARREFLRWVEQGGE